MTSGRGLRIALSCSFVIIFAVSWLLVIGGCGAKCNSPEGPSNGSTPRGAIDVVSVPAGAAVFLDGAATGAVTDTVLAGVVAGSHQVRVVLDGYIADPESILVNVADDDTASAEFTLTEAIGVGSILVLSDPPGAAIFLDSVATGFVTPDTLVEVPAGSHRVTVTYEDYTSAPAAVNVTLSEGEQEIASFTLTAPSAARLVLIEHFSNTSCDPCVEVEENLEILVPSLGFARVVTVGDHLYWPDRNDPFFLANSQQLAQRGGAFGVSLLPEVRINGVKFDDAADYDGFAGAVEEAEEEPPSFTIDVSATTVGDSFVVTGSVKKIADTAEGDEVLVVAVIETDIHYAAANGVDFFDDILRRFLPGTGGSALALTVGESASFRYAAQIGVGWISQNLEAVAFVESATSRKVYQAGSTR